ncbi:MAG: hypothetical protein OHK93_000040 [Ramalina farinacea]|uniref:Anucleate primary sterigmata protein B n=1 Tax=Ramalina farinacea TaxID=258253 RepID=A0AA43TN18_9LECA|nr:hypothetical protein [Ramalina farinacea]
MAAQSRPSVSRKGSHVPGGFDTDDDLSPIKPNFGEDDLPPLDDTPVKPSTPMRAAPQHAPSHDDSSMMAGENDTFLQEKEMRRQLEELDSTFLPDVSPVGPAPRADLSSISEERAESEPSTAIRDRSHSEEDPGRLRDRSESPLTPPHMYQTPAPGRADLPSDDAQENSYGGFHPNTSSLETMSSSPMAAAAARTVSRAVSSASTSNDTVDESRGGVRLDQDDAPTRAQSSTPRAGSPTPMNSPSYDKRSQKPESSAGDSPSKPRRPSYLQDRMASGRSSYSYRSTASTGSDITLGADYALQSGGAVPQRGSLTSRPSDFTRSISLGSVVSGISDSDDRNLSKEGGLYTLQEQDRLEDPETPIASRRNISTPTDTAIARHVKDVQVPETLAREYGNRRRQQSPERRTGAPTPSAGRNGNTLTLKEQSGTIDRLMKENWNLKLKITFLDEALNRTSDESIKAMISENVDLRTAKFQFAKETREFKRTIRDLERKLQEKSEELAQKMRAAVSEVPSQSHDEESFAELEEEVMYLRERVMTYDVEIEKTRNEAFVHDTEKKKLAEVVKQLSATGRGADIGAREEVDLWKDLLDAETARREQADEDNRKLRDEIRRMKSDASSTTTNNHATNVYNVSRKQKLSSHVSFNEGSERGFGQNGPSSAVSSTLVEQLRHENAELRREVGAQMSMLTSRHRERERLQQEIEDLKLGSRQGTRSMAGDSILDRSASRAHGRPASRSSDQTRVTQASDEREALELKNGQLRDQNANLRLEIQSLASQADQLLDELEQLDVLKLDHERLQELYDNDIAEATDDLQNMQRERDDALRIQEEMEGELQDLKAEGSERIGTLEEEIDQRNHDLEHMQNEISNRTEDAEALRGEVRSLSEGLVRTEEEVERKSKRVRDLELELEELGHEADSMDKDLREERDKNHKLSVQHESAQGEVAFLREEQEGDKIKIGDLEDALNDLQSRLTSEIDKAKDLENSIAEERRQQELVGSQEKKDVQKMMNDLNRDLSASKEESRTLKKDLDMQTNEASSFRERLQDLETHLRHVLGDSNGNKSTFLVSITKLQKELEHTSSDLETTHRHLAEKDRVLKNRDALLENHGLESKKLADLLERERQGRRADKAQHEQWQRTHHHTSRTVTQKDTRIAELESSRQADRKRLSSLESQFKDQLSERNTLLLTLWNRVSSICGQDWAKQNSLINNSLPTLEAISNNPSTYAPFSKNLVAAVKHVEGIFNAFQTRIKNIERTLWSEYQALEHAFDSRIRRVDKLEATVQSYRISGTFTAAPEIAKLRGENRLLKSEISKLQKQELLNRHARGVDGGSPHHPPSAVLSDMAAPPPSLARHHSSSAVEHLNNAHAAQLSPSATSFPLSPSRRPSLRPPTTMASSTTIPDLPPPQEVQQQQPQQQQPPTSADAAREAQRWNHRVKEYERRLKAEREARLLDRSAARKRLDEADRDNRRLKGELERERGRRGFEMDRGEDDGGVADEGQERKQDH